MRFATPARPGAGSCRRHGAEKCSSFRFASRPTHRPDDHPTLPLAQPFADSRCSPAALSRAAQPPGPRICAAAAQLASALVPGSCDHLDGSLSRAVRVRPADPWRRQPGATAVVRLRQRRRSLQPAQLLSQGDDYWAGHPSRCHPRLLPSSWRQTRYRVGVSRGRQHGRGGRRQLRRHFLPGGLTSRRPGRPSRRSLRSLDQVRGCPGTAAGFRTLPAPRRPAGAAPCQFPPARHRGGALVRHGAVPADACARGHAPVWSG